RIRANHSGNCSSDTSSATSCGSTCTYQSLPSRSHICCLNSTGNSTLSTPRRLTPRRINGNTLSGSSAPATIPQQAALAPYCNPFTAAASGAPPTVSTTPLQRGTNIGFWLPSSRSARLITSATPSCSSQSRASVFPETATTR